MLHAHGSEKVPEKQPAAPRTPAPMSGPGGILGLQRTAGNAAVVRTLQLLGHPYAQPQRQSEHGSETRGEAVVQRVEESDSTVISGHGRFGQNQLIPVNPNGRGRALKATFTVPEGIVLVMYAPPGASLENTPAQHIEQGNPPTREQLELVLGQKRVDLPEDYPRTFRAGEEVINYQISPLQAEHLSEGAETVAASTTLKEKAEELAKQRRESGAEGPLTVHYACCGSGHSDRKEDQDLFQYKGWTVEMRRLPVPGKQKAQEEPEEQRESRRRR